MRFHFCLLLTGLALLSACNAEPPRTFDAPTSTLYVPSAAITQAPSRPINAYAALPGHDDPDFFVGRPDRIALGSTYVGGYAAYTTYTNDAQAISTPFGSGYRYRWVVEQGYAAPPAP